LHGTFSGNAGAREMLNLSAVAVGGALGALARYWVSGLLYKHMGTWLPYGTLGVNVLGSLLMGIVFAFVQQRAVPDVWRLAVAVGLLGAFTTFSTFSLDTLVLLQQGAIARAVANVIASVALCLTAVALGIMLGRTL
jgi:CrcB protein